LPPYAFAPAQAMCKQIPERLPKYAKSWFASGIQRQWAQKAKTRFERTQPDLLSTNTNLAEAVERVQEIVRPKPVWFRFA